MQGRQPDGSLTDVGMSVFGGSFFIFAVIDVKCGDLFFAEQPMEVLYDSIKVPDNIVACIIDMACVKTDAQLVRMDDTIIDFCQFFKRAADLGAFAGHGSRATVQGRSAVRTAFSPVMICRMPCFVPAPT